MVPIRSPFSTGVSRHHSAAWAVAGNGADAADFAGGVLPSGTVTFAAGATRKGQHVAMIGTSMCWGFITPDVDVRGGLISMPHVFNGARDAYVFGGAGTAGADAGNGQPRHLLGT